MTTKAQLRKAATALPEVEHVEEVAALHGVGPETVRLLREELARRGTSW
ncbi:hypothetical protein ACHAAC_00250 [Aeromicrobium sp. CF4.19]